MGIRGGKDTLTAAGYYTAVTPSRCPVCGATTLIIDVARGQLVCTSCGYVIDDTVFANTPSAGVAVEAATGPRYTSTERRLQRAMLSLATARARLTQKLGSTAVEIIEGLRSNPLAASEALRLLKNPCIKRLVKGLNEKLVAALIKTLLLYNQRGEYPLYSEVALEHNLSPREARTLRRLLRKALKCLEGEEATPMLLLKAQP